MTKRRRSAAAPQSFRPSAVYITDDVGFENHGSLVLFLIRERIADDWKSLCRAFHFDPMETHSGHFGLRLAIERLIDAELLVSANGFQGPYTLHKRWQAIQVALGVSLPQLANLSIGDAIAVKPVFGKPRKLDIAPHVFVAMPFAKKLQPTYRTIESVARELRITVARGDDMFSTAAVMNDIWERIANAGVMIGDCTNRNPNVFYEIGIAHTIGKPVVLITQATSDIPFDVGHIRNIRYEPTPNGRRRLRRALIRTLQEAARGIWLPIKTTK